MNFTIVLPTYKESGNISELLSRIYKVCDENKYEVEIIIVEDFSEETVLMEKIVMDMKRDNTMFITRHNERGLSSAIMNGIGKASNDKVLVMDTDLQHRPEDIREIIFPLESDNVDMVVGCRTEDFEMSFVRRVISYIATLLSFYLVTCRDPMSGFFAIKKRNVMKYIYDINQIGFKIGLEIMVKCEMRTLDVDIDFRSRKNGSSKMSFYQVILYLFQLFFLYVFIIQKKLISYLTNNNYFISY